MSRRLVAFGAGLALALGGARGARAQDSASVTSDTSALYRALDLEGAGKYPDAVPLFRRALDGADPVNALLGLERSYAELSMTDSLVPIVRALVARSPSEPTYNTVLVRSLVMLGRDADARAAFEQWVKASPGSIEPYRQYAQLLLQRNQAAAADSVLARARTGAGADGLDFETAQAQAALGNWEASARSFRRALRTAPWLVQAAVYALAPTPGASREAVTDALQSVPVEVGARRVLSQLDLSWGSMLGAWEALRDLPPDSAAADAWRDFADAASASEQWALARNALVAALRWRRTPELSLRAADAALRSGQPGAAMTLAPLAQAGSDSALLAHSYVPVHVRALAMLGRTDEASRLVESVSRWLTEGERSTLTQEIAWGWVRAGDTRRARAALTASGADADSSEAAGWLALYDGNLRAARRLLRSSTDNTPELAAALAIIARVPDDSAPALGAAFLALARGDTVASARTFAAAAPRYVTATPLLLLTAARLQSARGDEAAAVQLWSQTVAADSTAPEAAEAELHWARALRRRGDAAGATTHLEHMILNHPESALVPEARRELELARSRAPGTATQ